MRRPVHKLAALAALLFVSGLAILAWQWRTLRKWEAVPARVISSEVVPFQAGRNTRYRGEIEITYDVKDLRYRAAYSVPVINRSFEAARDNLLRYQPGATTTVYVNPNNGADFLVEKKNSMRFFAAPILLISTGVIVGFICVLLFLSMQRWLCPDCATSVALHHRFCFECGRKLPRAKKLVRV